MTEQNSRQFVENPIFREIHKNTWLRRIHPSSSKKKREKLWVVFCVHNDTDPFLETYTDNKTAVFHKPKWFVPLNTVQHISPNLVPNEQEYEFVLTLSSDVVRLAAPSWDQMLDWVEGLKSKLLELKVLTPKENVYTKLPDRPNLALLPTRDPTSPLPPPPPVPTEILPGIERTGSGTNYTAVPSVVQRSISQSNSAESTSAGTSSDNTDIFNFDQVHNDLPLSTGHGNDNDNLHYEHLFESGPSRVSNINDVVTSNRRLERSASCSPRILQPVPHPYKTLREQQVTLLEKEMKHPSGVRLQLRKKDCVSSIGFVDAFNCVWICGWKQKEHPMLYNALHIGDQIISIEGLKIRTAADAYRILQSHYCGLYVNIVVRRIPKGKVFVIHREVEGQDLGIIQENNTAVIHTIEEQSLAAKHGLTAKTKSYDGLSLTNWVLTEINGRPLNLFFKKNQVRDRLNSVGKDISILVQPLDLVKQIKKQMKGLKNYKEYILQ